MSPVLRKNQMTEEDIKLHYITPAINHANRRDPVCVTT